MWPYENRKPALVKEKRNSILTSSFEVSSKTQEQSKAHREVKILPPPATMQLFIIFDLARPPAPHKRLYWTTWTSHVFTYISRIRHLINLYILPLKTLLSQGHRVYFRMNELTSLCPTRFRLVEGAWLGVENNVIFIFNLCSWNRLQILCSEVNGIKICNRSQWSKIKTIATTVVIVNDGFPT